MIPDFCADQPFDASILGSPVWRLNDVDRADDAVTAARKAGVGLLVYRGPGKPRGLRPVETLITFEGAVSKAEPSCAVRPAERAEADDVAEIARTSFRTDRWHADPAISNDKADAFKATWARNAVLGRADTVFVVEREGRLVGFNAVLSRDGVAVIDLIAVAPGNQGQGLGRALIEAMGSIEAQHARVGTQASNAASIALYRSVGFAPVSRAETWHWTP